MNRMTSMKPEHRKPRTRHNIFEGLNYLLISGGGNLLKHQPHLIAEHRTFWQRVIGAKMNIRLVAYDQIQSCTSELCSHPKGMS